MRNPLDWALRLFPLGDGTPVRLHAAFFVFALGLTLRQLQPPGGDRAVEVVLFTGPLFLLVILVHELGRYAAARRCGGDLGELLLWPAGGLRAAEFPHDPRGQVLGSLGGLAASGASVLLGSGVLVGFGFVPNLRPLADPYLTEVSNYRDQRVYTSAFAVRLYEPGSSTPAQLPPPLVERIAKTTNPAELTEEASKSQLDRALLPRPLVWLHRFVWLSWVLFLVNLLPAWPLDMGGVLQGAVSARSDDQTAVSVTAYAGFVVAGVATIAALGFNEVAPVLLAMVVALFAYWRLVRPDEFDSGMGGMGGSNFGAGGSSGDYGGYGYSAPEEPAAPKSRVKKPPMVKRFLLARAARRMHKENERRQADLDRMDALLEKIARTGQQSLTDEERRFLERVSTRFHNR